MQKKLVGYAGIALLLVALLAVNMISARSFRGVKMDLTGDKLYTLSDGTRNILRNLQEPITLNFYFSRKLARGNPGLNDYARRVEELLLEYKSHAGEMLTLNIIDPEPFSEAEERAAQARLQAAPVSQTERLYFGLQGINSVDGREVIPFFTRDKEQFLEYEITKLIAQLNEAEKLKVTILTDLPIQGEAPPPMAMRQQQRTEPWVIYQELTALYDVEVIRSSATTIPEDTKVLMVIHPKNLSEGLQYSIDQYVLSGRNAIIFVDPLCDADQPDTDPNNPLAAMTAPKNSDMPTLLRNWGVELVESKIVGDRANAQSVRAGTPQAPEIVPFILFVGLTRDQINQDEYYSRNLDSIMMAYPGALRTVAGATTTITPILQTSSDSQLVDTSVAQMFPDPKRLLREFESLNERQLLGVSISGNARSAFPEGNPLNTGEEAPDENHIAESKTPVKVLVFSDVDMLTDRTWVQVINVGIPGFPPMVQKMANNGDLVVSAVDHLAGSSDLISIRSRGSFSRPFEVVREMERRAQENSAQRLRELEERLEETQQNLRDLQRTAPDGSLLISSSDLRREIEKFQEQERETKIQLRRLELSLRQDVEKLGQRLKFYNIALIPILVGLLAVTIGAVKVNRRKRRK